MQRAAQSTKPEDIFVDLFREVFGLEKAQMLVHEFPYRDFLGNHRFVDYALKTTDTQVAFEIDGPDHYNVGLHQGLGAFLAKFEDDLLRQNSLISDRWRVFRWTDRQLTQSPEFVKEQLALFLANIPGLLEFDDFLPKQQGDVLELRAHQQDARGWLDRIRAEGKTIALLQHATGTGKTVVAIADAKAFNGRTLYLANWPSRKARCAAPWNADRSGQPTTRWSWATDLTSTSPNRGYRKSARLSAFRK